MTWFDDLNGGNDFIKISSFSFTSHKHLIYIIGIDGPKGIQPITKNVFKRVVEKVNKKCEGVP